MRKLVLLAVLIGLLAVPNIASAGPPGQSITFRFNEGQFCVHNCTPAFAKLDGRIEFEPRIQLSRLSGKLRIGVSPFAKTDRHLNVKSPGPVNASSWGTLEGYEECIASEEPFDIGQTFWGPGEGIDTVVSLSAGSSKGSGTLGWWYSEICRWFEVEGGGFDKETGLTDRSYLNGELVGPKLAGTLNPGGPAPEFSPP